MTKSRLPAKIFLTVFSVLMFTATFISGTLTMICYQNNMLDINGREELLRSSCGDAASQAVFDLRENIKKNNIDFEITDGKLIIPGEENVFKGLTPDECNFAFVIKDASGKELYSDIPNSEMYSKISWDSHFEWMVINSDVKTPFYEKFDSVKQADDAVKEMLGNVNFRDVGVSMYVEIVKYNFISPSDTSTQKYEIARVEQNGDIVYGENYAWYSSLEEGDLFSGPMGDDPVLSKYEDKNSGDDSFRLYMLQKSSEESNEENDASEESVDTEEPFIQLSVTDPIDGYISQLVIGADGTVTYRDKPIDITDPTQLAYFRKIVSNLTFSQRTELSLIGLDGLTAVKSITVEGEYVSGVGTDFYVDTYISRIPRTLDRVGMSINAVQTIAKFVDLYPVLLIITASLTLLSYILLAFISGIRAADGTCIISRVDQIPFEIFAVLTVLGIVLDIRTCINAVYHCLYTNFYSRRISEIAICTAYVILSGFVAALTVLTLFSRIKSKKLLRTTVIGYAALILFKLFRLATYVVKSARLTLKTAVVSLGVAATTVVIIFAALYFENLMILFTIIVFEIILASLAIVWAAGFTNLRDYIKKIAAGELDAKIDREHLIGDLKIAADELENIGEGVKNAVDERMRSERLKTELITNVSHDLKTPLTSIVNYVDILSKDDIPDVEAQEHIGILKRQSARMKKLIEDLMEVSKAASGNVSVNPERTDINLLITQSAAEYADKFEACELTPVIKIPNETFTASLDGRLMWRVFDNLMGNICKYALPGTRVYISVEDMDESVSVCFKNISKFPIDISGEELMERFVRGDSSRNTEGSGLGLSIAKSLCDLQGVEFNLIIDGDLFKACLYIKKSDDSDLIDDTADSVPIVGEDGAEAVTYTETNNITEELM